MVKMSWARPFAKGANDGIRAEMGVRRTRSSFPCHFRFQREKNFLRK